jgi:hypothetical protein
MYLLRYIAADNTVQHGYLEGENIGSLSGDLFGDFVRGGLVARLARCGCCRRCSPARSFR